jgi:hypothetical protein
VRVLCAIPVFNEEVAIGSIVLRAAPHVQEVLVVDDGSKDRSADVARRAGATVITHERNRGYGGAYRTLWDYARDHDYDVLITLDGDGQHEPEDIPGLVAKIQEGYDYVIGARWGEKTQMPIWRRVGKRVLDYSTAMAAEGGKDAKGQKRGDVQPRLTDSQSGFKAYGRRAIAEIYPGDEGMAVTSMLLIEAHQKGLKIGETPIHCRYDVEGSSQGPVSHATDVLNQVLLEVGLGHPMLYLALPGLVLGLGSVGAAMWASLLMRQDPTSGSAWFAVAILLFGLSLLGLFAGLLFNLLPRAVSDAVRKHVPRPK